MNRLLAGTAGVGRAGSQFVRRQRYLIGYLAQGVGAPAPGAVVTAHGLMPGLQTGPTVFGTFFVIVLIGGLTVLAPAPPARWPCHRPNRGSRSGGGSGSAVRNDDEYFGS